jgi:hypothetical protein
VKGVLAALRVPEFRALLASYAINRAGDVVGAIALAVAVFAATGSALATAALFLATQFVPGLLGPALVVRLDRFGPGRLLPVLYALECAVFVCLAAIVGHVSTTPIVILALVDAMLAFVARTLTRSASATMLVPHDLMPEGKAAFNVALAVATVGGPALAGAVLALFGPATALLIDAGSFLVAAILLAREPRLRRSSGGAHPPGPPRGRLREGWQYIAARPPLRALILGEGAAFVFFYLVVPVTVVYATHSLQAGAGGYAAILGSWGAGIALGSAIQVAIARRVRSSMILLSTGAVAIAYIGTAVAPSLAVACVASVIGGIGNGTQWASVETAVHRLVDEAFRVRTAAALEALATIAPGVGIVLGGVLTTLLSARAAYLAAGIGLSVLVLGAWVSRLSLSEPAAPVPVHS